MRGVIRMYRSKFLAFSLFILGSALNAEEPSHGFTFESKPIRPECLGHWESPQAPVNLASDKCQRESKELDSQKLKEGFIGYGSVESPPSFYYKPLGKIHFQDMEKPEYFLVYTESSGGGTGFDTALNVYKIDKGVLTRIDVLDAGDRCDGGISHAYLKDGVLAYKKNLTPMSLYSLFQTSTEIKPTFDDCMACCIGQLRYRKGDITTFEFASATVQNLSFGTNPMQDCFNQVVKETMDAGKSLLTKDELKAFTFRVKERCVTHSK